MQHYLRSKTFTVYQWTFTLKVVLQRKFALWSFFLLRLLFVSINLPNDFKWNTIVKSRAGAHSLKKLQNCTLCIICIWIICIFIKARKGERCLWDVNSSVIYKLHRSFLYSDLSSVFSSCTSVSHKPRLILLSRQGFTHTDLFLFFLFF